MLEDKNSIEPSGKPPMVTVIIPTRNRAELVFRSVQSVLSQTYKDFELILIDDASEDNTFDVIHELADKRITYVRNAKPRGAAVARNKGITAARGQFIAFLDSDDEWLPFKLARQVAMFQSLPDKVGAIYTGLTAFDLGKKRKSTRKPKKAGNLLPDLYYGNVVGPLSTLAVRSGCFNAVGQFDEQFPSCQDWDLCIRIAQKYYFAYDKECLVKYYIGEGSITKDMEAKAMGHEMILKKYYGKIELDRKAHSRQQLTIGHYFCRSGHIQRAHYYFLRAIFTYPFSPRSYFYLLCSIMGISVYNRFVAIRQSL